MGKLCFCLAHYSNNLVTAEPEDIISLSNHNPGLKFCRYIYILGYIVPVNFHSFLAI